MEMNKVNEVNVKKKNEKRYKPSYWTSFRQPNNLDKIIFDDAWSDEWIRQPGWRSIWARLWFEGKAKEIPVDLKELEDKYQISAKIPGASKKDIDIQITNENIAIRADIQSTKNKQGPFSFVRSISFPNEINADYAKAFLTDGLLNINIPKKKKIVEQMGRKIEVKSHLDNKIKNDHRSN